MPRTFYDVLGVPTTATLSQIKDKYRAAARTYHPDVAVDKIDAARQFVQINRAYRVLRDAEQRRQYDCSLLPQSKPNGDAAPAPAARVDVAQLVQEAEGLFMQARLPEARALCAKALKQDGRHAHALVLLGDILLGQGKPQEAAVAFRLSLQVAPSALVQAKLARLAQQNAALAAAPPAASAPQAAAPEPKQPSLLRRLFDRT